LLIVFAGGSHCLWCLKNEWNPLLDASVALKKWQNWIKCEEITMLQNRWGQFYRKFSIVQLIAYFHTPPKILKYYYVAFRVTRWFAELKMVISEKFKSLKF
jgi:hypothetical protein